MKMYKKAELNLINGMLVTDDGDIVMPDAAIVLQANELETLLQRFRFLANQPSATPMPSLDGFKRDSIHDSVIGKFDVKTPLLDAEAKKSMDLMDELDGIKTTDQANAMLADFADLVEFVNSDYVVGGFEHGLQFDTPQLGSILDITCDDIVDVIAHVCGMGEENDDDVEVRYARVTNLDELEQVLDEIKSTATELFNEEDEEE